MGKRYTIGIDYGTESGRALLVDLETGEEAATHVTPYPHGVIDKRLPGSGIKLGADWALQHPGDYVEVLRRSVPAVLQAAGVSAEQVIGIGVDFTACTMMPLDETGTPLCLLPEWQDDPHSWVKLWKHHAAQEEANRLNEIAASRGEAFLARYGGKISSEWMIPKVWQIYNEAPHIYAASDRFMEAADWIVMQMTGVPVRNSCTAGYKGLWHKQDGYPSREFFAALAPGLADLTETKLRGEIAPLGARAGGLNAHMAEMMGLRAGTAVAVAVIDAHAMVPACKVVAPGSMVLAMGTSTCHLLLSDQEIHAEGISGVVEDGIVAGLFGYEAGQAAVGDIFGWYVEQAVPASVHKEAAASSVSVHAWLEQAAAAYKPGESGLIALDWWNGSRSVLVDADLSGLLIGCTLQTKPQEIYRALLEATAFGTRKIIEAFTESGIEVEELVACGGLPQRNRLIMQIYADVTGREIKIADSVQTAALGAAMFGAVAAGSAAGGYDSIVEAAAKMARLREETYKPNPAHTAVYDELYKQYLELHDYFGRGASGVMKRLKELKMSAAE
ncbi:ribulokinase [Paenibacillus sp. GCM10027626]|uniref:ribulokinase n=1 Tax=Paenibacillus sp. GCM10027626 TaxID=3273411 RepID=UPI00363BDE2B